MHPKLRHKGRTVGYKMTNEALRKDALPTIMIAVNNDDLGKVALIAVPGLTRHQLGDILRGALKSIGEQEPEQAEG